MKGRTPFQASEKQSQHHKSRESSPHPTYRNEDQEPLSQQTQYRLEKMFEEAGNREEKYIQIIKEQESKLKNQAEQYLQNLKLIKNDFIQFMSLKKDPTKKSSKIQSQLLNFPKKKQVSRQNSKEFNLKTKKQIQKLSEHESSRVEPYLICKIHAYYYTPFVKDYIREIVPNQMMLILRSIYLNKQLSQQIQIVKDEDEYNNINCLIEKIPFQISTPEQTAIIMEFVIPCDSQAINYYKKKQFQLELVNKQGMFVYAYSKINLSSLLYYEDTPTDWQIKPLPFYSAQNSQIKVGELSMKLGNRLQLMSKNEQYKIQSTKPMQVNDFKSLINYNDEESRMIQRISKFKTNSNSLLLGIGQMNEANAEKYFQNENQKIILMHRKKKELDSIQQYKNSHKDELMGKLLNEAINRYYLTESQIGKPKYLIFNFLNKENQHRKIFLKTILKLRTDESKPPKIALLNIQDSIHVSIINPKIFPHLIEKQLIHLTGQGHYDYDMDEQENFIWTISGMLHPIVLRIICFPPKQSLITKQNLAATYDLALKVTDEFDREVDSFETKIIMKEPTIQHRFYFHGYHQTSTQLEIPFDDQNQQVTAKNAITNSNNLRCDWDQKWSRLSLQIEHNAIGQQTLYLIINDSDHYEQINCFQGIVYTYPKLSHSIKLAVGQVYKLKLQFSFDQKTLTQKYQTLQSQPLSKSKKAKQQIRMMFVSSKPEHCFVRCQNQQEMICKLNKIYEIEARIQSFTQDANQKIIIHALDADSNTVIKRWFINIEKQDKQTYSRVYKLFCEHGKPFIYKFQLHNSSDKQSSFRLYSSNLSIMKTPLQLISLMTNQIVNVDLQFVVKQILSKEELSEPLQVILTVTDGNIFSNYLFEITVKVS